MYKRMRARVAETIQLGKGEVILKYIPCTVVGWELHPIDRLQGSDAERRLSKLPTCIFLKIGNTNWVIGKDLGTCVYPMLSVRRTWILNAKTEANIHRTEYPLLPDFAWTAFMAHVYATESACRRMRRCA